MSFADRLKSKLTGGAGPGPGPGAGPGAGPGPVPVPVHISVPIPVATNDNNFIPTKYGEELPHAVRTYLPRGQTSTTSAPSITINITDESAFPLLGGKVTTPKTNTAMNRSTWADKAREWAEKDAVDTSAIEEYM